MNCYLTCSSAILCSFLATGCSTHTTNQTREVSDSAITYTVEVNKLLEAAKDRAIELDSRQLGMLRANHSKKEKEEKLEQKTKVLSKWLTLIEQLQDQNVLLQKYFKTLQVMVDEPLQSDMHARLGKISQSISKINHARSPRYSEHNKRALSDIEADYVGGLSKTLISNHYAARVRQVLIRDRDIIDRQISLHEQQIKEISLSYKRRNRIHNAEHYRDNVLIPFLGNSPRFNVDTWATSRRQWFENKKALKIFDDLKDANKAFRDAWSDVLQGKKDVGAVKAILSDVNQFVDNAHQLHDSRHNPYGDNFMAPPTMQ